MSKKSVYKFTIYVPICVPENEISDAVDKLKLTMKGKKLSNQQRKNKIECSYLNLYRPSELKATITVYEDGTWKVTKIG